ncbi:hypothetical protein XANCAGTX0491_001463 [Xanthoria calcicola]
MLDQENAGLQHVRSLILSHRKDDLGMSMETDQYLDAAQFVYRLPKHVLTNFQWDSWHRIPSRIIQTLYTRQRSLRHLEVLHTEKLTDEEYGSGPSSLLSGFSDVERLRIMPGFLEPIPQVAHQFFQEPHHIRHLILELDQMASLDEGQDPRSSSSAGLLELFGGLERSTVRLQTLDLAGIDLLFSRQSLVLALDIPSLESLVIRRCEHAENFLQAFRSTRSKPSTMNLTSFEIYHAQIYQNEDPDTSTAEEQGPDLLLATIDTFLTTISPLRKLSICLRGFDELPNVASVARHSPSLRTLFMDVRKAKGFAAETYSSREWETLCTSFERIYQLDMAFPQARVDRKLWHDEFSDFMSSTDHMPTLRTLGIHDWPIVSQELASEEEAYSAFTSVSYKRNLASLATEIQQRRKKSHAQKGDLNIIRFGLQEEITNQANWGYHSLPSYFVKSRVQVLGGEEIVKMEPMSERSGWDVKGEMEEYDIDFRAHHVGRFEAGVDVDV